MINLSRPMLRSPQSLTQCLKKAQRRPQSRIVILARRQLLLFEHHAHLRPIQQCRHKYTLRVGIKSRGTVMKQLKDAAKENPFGFWLAISCLFSCIGFLVYANYQYITYIIGSFRQYPEPVAKEMRKALFYTNVQLDVDRAVTHYRRAIELCRELNMSPFTDQVLGIKIQLAFLMEKVGHYDKAIELLGLIRGQCFEWVRNEGPQHFGDGHRSRVLGKTVALGVKMAGLLADPSVARDADAEAVLVSVVETVLREQQRRARDGVQDGEGPWVTDEEAGASMEALAHTYEKASQHHLATPLFLQALAHAPRRSCRAAILMNNIATSLAQQDPPPSFYAPPPPPPPPSASFLSDQPESTQHQPTAPRSFGLLKPSPSSGPPEQQQAQQYPQEPVTPPTRAQRIAQAEIWARHARALASEVQASDGRTEECEQACAVATHNLGEFAEMLGQMDEARAWYEEARKLAQGMGFREGVKRAGDGMRRVEGR